ncbi:hypothetical protein WN48_06748 [Eufriesea mexicana]|uniref:Uncharacterized protein n=1 Tax=Eufriesea mexicana TaxID=516756 RepID=A0A310SFA1_9HYME|nr:PREDICTED: UPF0389 protein GA21628-like [Eufriesea mexicana]OAD59998.1 hypothetical protein WN48_06748 [Eufriesea mexicana]
MFCARLIRQFKFRGRQLHSTLVKNESKPVSETTKSAETSKASESKSSDQKLNEFAIGSPMYALSNFDKRILVWVKRFPSLDQVPDQVSIRTIQLAHTKARIIVCGYMMVFAIIGCIIAVSIGKRDTAAGENIATVRMRWYKEVAEKGRKEAEARRANEANTE